MSSFELTTLVVIGTDYICSCKVKYYTITKAPILKDNKYIFTCVHIVRNVKQMNIKDVSVDFLCSLVTPGKVNLMYIGDSLCVPLGH